MGYNYRMLTPQRLLSISDESIRNDVVALMVEFEKLTSLTRLLAEKTEEKLMSLEKDMLKLEEENQALRANNQGVYVQRDSCIALLARMATGLGLKAGTTEVDTASGKERRVVVDLPSGQVSWEFLPDEAHLFEALPGYAESVEAQSIQDTYARVMNPGLSV